MPKELTVPENRCGKRTVYLSIGVLAISMIRSLIADGQGGAIFAWWDISTPDWNIFAQRLSAEGSPLWNSG